MKQEFNLSASDQWLREKAERYPWLSISSLLLLSAVLAVLMAFAISRAYFAAPGFDQSWFLYAAERALDGVPLYSRQLTEVNPPLAIWFSVLPVVLARMFHASPMTTLKVFTIALMVLSAGWCTRVLRAAKVATSPLMAALVFFAVASAEISLYLSNVGQREQFIVIFTLPYLFYVACYPKLHFTAVERGLLGVLAGIGVCFKPQELLILVCAEAFLLLWFRNLRRLFQLEVLGVVAGIGGYILTVRLATPYFKTVPLLKDTFWAYADCSKLLLFENTVRNHKFLLAIVLWIVVRRYLRYPTAPAVLLAASFGAGIAFAVQGTSWDSHLFPCNAFLYTALGWIGIELLARIEGISPTGIKAALIVFFCLAIALPIGFRYEAPRNVTAIPSDTNFKIWAQYPARTSVYVFSTGLGEQFIEILKHDLLWGSRYAHLWMLPAIVDNEQYLAGGPSPAKLLTAARTAQLATMLHSDATEDLHANKPAVVLVEHCNPAHPCQALSSTTFDMLGWFLRSPAFAAEWNHYRLASQNSEYDEYVRVP